jgi:hypothetical protein
MRDLNNRGRSVRGSAGCPCGRRRPCNARPYNARPYNARPYNARPCNARGRVPKAIQGIAADDRAGSLVFVTSAAVPAPIGRDRSVPGIGLRTPMLQWEAACIGGLYRRTGHPFFGDGRLLSRRGGTGGPPTSVSTAAPFSGYFGVFPGTPGGLIAGTVRYSQSHLSDDKGPTVRMVSLRLHRSTMAARRLTGRGGRASPLPGFAATGRTGSGTEAGAKLRPECGSEFRPFSAIGLPVSSEPGFSGCVAIGRVGDG